MNIFGIKGVIFFVMTTWHFRDMSEENNASRQGTYQLKCWTSNCAQPTRSGPQY